MSKAILLTGGTGFIGRNVLKRLLESNYKVILLSRKRPSEVLDDNVSFVNADLSNLTGLKNVIKNLNYDALVHIGALRGGKKANKEMYRKVNVEATQVLAEDALHKSAHFVFCSSVGVFGAIPEELPPKNDTFRCKDNYYHETKILAETEIERMGLSGLEYTILRPSITHGAGDFGFPYTLVSMVDKGIFVLSSPGIKIGMVDVESVANAFVQTINNVNALNKSYILSDKSPVSLRELVNYISEYLKGKKYAVWKTLPSVFFDMCTFIAGKIVKNELWKARFELISKSWYYDSTAAEKDLGINFHETIPSFQKTIDWYLQNRNKRV